MADDAKPLSGCDNPRCVREADHGGHCRDAEGRQDPLMPEEVMSDEEYKSLTDMLAMKFVDDFLARTGAKNWAGWIVERDGVRYECSVRPVDGKPTTEELIDRAATIAALEAKNAALVEALVEARGFVHGGCGGDVPCGPTCRQLTAALVATSADAGSEEK